MTHKLSRFPYFSHKTVLSQGSTEDETALNL